MTFGSNRPPEPQGRPVPRPPFQQSPPRPGLPHPHQPIAPPPNPDAVPTTGFRIPTPPPGPPGSPPHPGSPPQPDLEPKPSRKQRRQDKKREKRERQLSAATADEAPKTGFFRTRRGAFLRWTALVVGLLLIGASLGYLVFPRSGGNDNPVVLPASAYQPRTNAGDMPSVLGLSRDVAMAAITDAGADGASVDFIERPAAGPIGTVLEQKPQAGQQPGDTIELVVSTPTSMPPVVGKPGDEIRRTLENLGAVVAVEKVVDPGAASGSVISADPREGETIPTMVTLRVADPGDALSLSKVSSIDSSSCSTSSSDSVNGVTFANNITCRPGSSEASVEYALSRHAALFDATIGTDDKGKAGPATVRIIVDGRPAKTVDVALGKSVPVSVDVRGALRMKIVVTTPARDDPPTVVFGEALLRGSTEGLDQIAGN